ncbi:MAG TPA: hypothetical protein VIY71_09430 [Solirubrobacterales bacterium]
MQDLYRESADDRAAVLPALQAFLLSGRDAIEEALRIVEPGRSDLRAELDAWESITSTAAHEIIESEVKFRAMLWAIGEIDRLRELEDDPNASSYPDVVALTRARGLVNKLNNFGQMVELNLFSQDDVFGHLHRSIAAAGKAVEPLIWQENVVGGRWGLRVLRLLLRAESFNDVRPIHRGSDLVWSRGPDDKVLVRASLYRSDYGRTVRTDRFHAMKFSERLSLRAAATWARLWPRYGGQRLRRHRIAENDLIGRLMFAYKFDWKPLDLTGWDMARLESERKRHWEEGIAPSPNDPG